MKALEAGTGMGWDWVFGWIEYWWVVLVPVGAGPAEAGTPTWVVECAGVGLWIGVMGGVCGYSEMLVWL